MYQITDAISGRPAGAKPVIRTWYRRARTRARRPRAVILVPAGHPLVELGGPHGPEPLDVSGDARYALWAADVPLRYDRERRALDYQALERRWDVYRSPVVSAATWCCPRHHPVSERELEAAEGDEERVRRERGDGDLGAWIDVAPWRMDRADAEAAGALGLTTAELYRGVREEHGRWQGYVGLGGFLRQVATCDTREEALALATAHLWRSWLHRVEQIREARGGDLSWGWPLPSPVLTDEDPQEGY